MTMPVWLWIILFNTTQHNNPWWYQNCYKVCSSFSISCLILFQTSATTCHHQQKTISKTKLRLQFSSPHPTPTPYIPPHNTYTIVLMFINKNVTQLLNSSIKIVSDANFLVSVCMLFQTTSWESYWINV